MRKMIFPTKIYRIARETIVTHRMLYSPRWAWALLSRPVRPFMSQFHGGYCGWMNANASAVNHFTPSASHRFILMTAVCSDYIIQCMLHTHYSFMNPDVFIGWHDTTTDGIKMQTIGGGWWGGVYCLIYLHILIAQYMWYFCTCLHHSHCENTLLPFGRQIRLWLMRNGQNL